MAKEPVAKLLRMEKSMILSQFASHAVAEAPTPSTYLSKVELGGGVAPCLNRGLKRAVLP
jgi:hypothetical protein